MVLSSQFWKHLSLACSGMEDHGVLFAFVDLTGVRHALSGQCENLNILRSDIPLCSGNTYVQQRKSLSESQNMFLLRYHNFLRISILSDHLQGRLIVKVRVYKNTKCHTALRSQDFIMYTAIVKLFKIIQI